MHVRWSTAAVSTAALLLSTGCFKSYVAVSFRSPELGVSEATVTGSLPAGAAIRTVALRAPSGCRADGAPPAAGAGVALRSRAVVASRCEAWLSELEAALASRFTIVGWRALAGSAKAPEADLVLAVRDLHVEPLLVSGSDPAAVRLTTANARGEPAGGRALSPKADATIRRLVAARYADGALGGVRATIEVEALPAAGGEPLWTYRASVADDLSGALESRMLVRGRAGSWTPVLPRGWRPPSPAPAGETVEDPVRARLRELAAAVAADVVASFPPAG